MADRSGFSRNTKPPPLGGGRSLLTLETTLFDELIEMSEKTLKESGKRSNYADVINVAALTLISNTQSHEAETVKIFVAENDAFVRKNRDRWDDGFQKIHALRETAIQAGIFFQKKFHTHSEYQHDLMLGVLMRQHANACRISGEIIHLLEGGYPDGAIARWRTLYEIVITCMIIRKYGSDAAVDYVKHGIVKNTEGMLEYQKTAENTGLPPFSEEEIVAAKKQKDEITLGDNNWHWARKHTGFSKLEKLREHVDMEKWSHNYKLASRNIHSDYYEMANLHAMSETKNDLLLVGPSISGMTTPAHFTAISLAQVTCMFVLAYSDDDQCAINFTDSLLFMRVIDNYVEEVGTVFSGIEKSI